MNKDLEPRTPTEPTEPLRPLIVHVIYALGTGGLENGLVNILNRAPVDRYRHAIICLTHSGPFAARLTVPDIEVIELHKKPGHDLGMYWRLWKQLRRLRPSIVHTRNLAALETQLLGVLLPGCKRVHGEHGRDVTDLDGTNRKYQRLRRLVSPLVHRFIAVSRDLSDWLVDTVGIRSDKVVQIYNGVDAARFTPATAAYAENPESNAPDFRILMKGMPPGFLPARGAIVVGTVGRLATVKNQALLLDAFHALLQQQPDLQSRLRCIIVGDGPERPALEAQIQSLAMSDQVWLTGDKDDVARWLACMDIFVLPSLGEGISNTILEAMASGLPVIASDVGGNPELVEEGVTGLLFPSGESEALTEALARLVEDPFLRSQMSRSAVRRIERDFDWDRTVAEYLGVYDELLYGSSRSPAHKVDQDNQQENVDQDSQQEKDST